LNKMTSDDNSFQEVFYEGLGEFKEIHKELNLKERLCAYTGVALGFLAPIAASRYDNFPASNNATEEAVIWLQASLQAFPYTLITVFAGGALGVACALKLKNRRLKRKQELQDMFGIRDYKFEPVRQSVELLVDYELEMD